MFSPCPFVGLWRGLHENYWTDFHETWMKDGSQSRIDPITFLWRSGWRWLIQDSFLTFFWHCDNWDTNRFKYVSLDIKLDYIKEMCALLSVILVSKSFQMLWEAQTNQQTNGFCVARQNVRVCSTPDSWRRLEFEPHHRPISIFTSS